MQPEMFEGKNVDVEVTPQRVSIIRDDRVTDIEMRSITGVEIVYPKLTIPGTFRILYAGGQPPAGALLTLDTSSLIEFSKKQESDFQRLRALIHQYQDALIGNLS